MSGCRTNPSGVLCASLFLVGRDLPGKSQVQELELSPVNPLQPEEKGKLIDQYLQRFGKELDDTNTLLMSLCPAEQRIPLSQDPPGRTAGNGTFEGLSQRIAQYMKAEDIPQLLREVLLRWQGDYERDRPGLVKDALSFILAARRGLSESELLEMLRPADLPKLPTAIWSPLRAALDESLVERAGILNFAHDYLRRAVQGLYLPDSESKKNIRLLLADYFEVLEPSLRSCDELPWLLHQSKASTRLKECLLDLDRFTLFVQNNQFELRNYWYYIDTQNEQGFLYLSAYEKWKETRVDSNQMLFQTATTLGTFLDMQHYQAEARYILNDAISYGEKSGFVSPLELALAYQNLGLTLKGAGGFSDAEKCYNTAIQIIINKCDSINVMDTPVLVNLAMLYKAQKKLKESEKLNKELIIYRQNKYGYDDPKVATAINNLADTLLAEGKLDEATIMFRRSLCIRLREFGISHPLTGNSLNNLSGCLVNSNRLTEAEQLLIQSISILSACMPKEHPILKRTVLNLDRLRLRKQHVPDFGISQIIERIDGFPMKLAVVLYNQACEASSTGDFTTSETLLTEALSLYPDFEDAYYNRAEARIALDRFNEGISDLDKVISMNPRAMDAYVTRGAAKGYTNDHVGCISDSIIALSLGHCNPIVYYNLGLSYYSIHQNDNAICNLKTYIDSNTEDKYRTTHAIELLESLKSNIGDSDPCEM